MPFYFTKVKTGLGIAILCIFLLPGLRSDVYAVNCTRALSGNVTVTSSCNFPETVDGADTASSATATSNTSILAVSNNATLTINAGQTIVFGNSLTIADGSAIFVNETAQIKQSSIWYTDADLDGYPLNTTGVAQTTRPSNGARRAYISSLTALDCNDALAGQNCAKRVFAMAASGNMGGLSGADTLCQNRANTYISNPGTFKAWLSSTTVSAASRLTHATENYALVTGTVIANGWTDLTDGTIDNPINRDADGSARTGLVFTDTSTDGSIYVSSTAYSCNNWTSTSSSYSHPPGDTGATDSYWTRVTGPSEAKTCDTAVNIYCFEQ